MSIEVPDPKGIASGKQDSKLVEILAPADPPYVAQNFDQAFRGIAESGRGFGGNSTVQLYFALYFETKAERDSAQRKLELLQAENKRLEKDVADASKDVAVYKERVKGLGRLKTVRAVLTAFGAVLLSLGVKLIDTPHVNFGWAIILVAIVLLYCGWFTGSTDA